MASIPLSIIGSAITRFRGWIEFADEASNEVANRDRMACAWGEVVRLPEEARVTSGGTAGEVGVRAARHGNGIQTKQINSTQFKRTSNSTSFTGRLAGQAVK